MHGNSRPVGRPPLRVKSTHIRLGLGVPRRIDRVLGPKEKRADLIRQAVEREIARREEEAKTR